MKQSFNEIIEQIKNEEIKFPYSDTLFEEYSPENIDQLIYIAVENYTYSTIEEFKGYVNDLDFRTNNHGDAPIEKLIKKNIKSTGFYFDIAGPRCSDIMVEIDFPQYNDNTDFEEYINGLFALIDDRIVDRCHDFNADYEFNQLWDKSSRFTAREFLEILNEDESFYKEFADKLKGERIYDKLHRH